MIPVDINRPLHANAPDSWVLCPETRTAFRRALAYEREKLGTARCGRIVRAYLAGSTVRDVAEQEGASAAACGRLLRRRGIEIRRSAHYVRVHDARTDFFDDIDGEAKAYILGFVSADGWIQTRPRGVGVELKAEDLPLLERIRDELSPGQPVVEHPVTTKAGRRIQFRLQVNSVELADALERHGVGPRKSHTLRPSALVPAELLRHYWRGVVDGDGSIYSSKGRTPRSKPSWHFDLTGSAWMCEGFRAFLVEHGVGIRAQVQPSRTVFRLQFGGNGVARSAARLLYGGSTIHLDRKEARAEEVMALVGRFDARRRITWPLVMSRTMLGHTQRRMARDFGVAESTMSKVRRELGIALPS